MSPVIMRTEFQIRFAEYSLRVSVVVIAQSRVGKIVPRISAVVSPRLICSSEKQLVRVSYSSVITICNIHKIILFVFHLENIPHVRFYTAVFDYVPAGKNTLNTSLKFCVITQILECLSISLTYNVGIGICVKNPDHLPGISIVCFARSRVVIGNKLADLVLIPAQFFFI